MPTHIPLPQQPPWSIPGRADPGAPATDQYYEAESVTVPVILRTRKTAEGSYPVADSTTVTITAVLQVSEHDIWVSVSDDQASYPHQHIELSLESMWRLQHALNTFLRTNFAETYPEH